MSTARIGRLVTSRNGLEIGVCRVRGMLILFFWWGATLENGSGHPGVNLLSDLNDSDGAALTFDRVVQRIRQASTSIIIHMFVWRNDQIGNLIGQEVLDAANRGVKVHILKDLGAQMYERIEMNRKSFFNRSIGAWSRLLYRIRALTFPDTYVEDEYGFELGRQLMAHENVTIQWVDHTHTKYYIFDQKIMITGSINIEDRHRGYRDYMAEIVGCEFIDRFISRRTGAAEYDPDRSFEFVLNVIADGKKRFEIKPVMLQLMSRAKKSVYIEMAYIGDPDLSRKIIEISNRGVEVTVLFSKAANIGNDINYRSLFHVCKRGRINVYLSEKMIHSKLVLIDDQTVIMGSANMSVFSMRKAVELDLVVKDDQAFIESVKETRDLRVSEGQKVDSVDQLGRYNGVIAAMQQLHQYLH